MQTPNATQSFRSGNPVWYLLAEFPLSEILFEHDQGYGPKARCLFQAVKELGMPLECVENIEITMAGFAKEALAHFKQGKVELPGRIRVYCQNKIIEVANSTRAYSQPCHAEQSVEQLQLFYQSTAKMGGWGYFLIERGWNFPVDSLEGQWNTIDLYLYKEGK